MHVCGRADLPLTIDHIIPKSKAVTTVENLVAACLPCNNKKGDRTLEEADMNLKIRPYTPNHILFIKSTSGDWRTHGNLIYSTNIQLSGRTI